MGMEPSGDRVFAKYVYENYINYTAECRGKGAFRTEDNVLIIP